MLTTPPQVQYMVSIFFSMTFSEIIHFCVYCKSYCIAPLRHLWEPQVVADPQAHAEAARGRNGSRRPQFIARLRPVGLAQPELSRDLDVKEVRLGVGGEDLAGAALDEDVRVPGTQFNSTFWLE